MTFLNNTDQFLWYSRSKHCNPVRDTNNPNSKQFSERHTIVILIMLTLIIFIYLLKPLSICTIIFFYCLLLLFCLSLVMMRQADFFSCLPSCKTFNETVWFLLFITILYFPFLTLWWTRNLMNGVLSDTYKNVQQSHFTEKKQVMNKIFICFISTSENHHQRNVLNYVIICVFAFIFLYCFLVLFCYFILVSHQIAFDNREEYTKKI